jgi:Tfp pilus assembly protein PilO
LIHWRWEALKQYTGAIVNQPEGSALIEWNLAKILIVLLLAAAVISLGLGFGHLMHSKDNEDDQRRVFRSLVKRVAFSLVAMAVILYAGFSGMLNQ